MLVVTAKPVAVKRPWVVKFCDCFEYRDKKVNAINKIVGQILISRAN